MKAQSFLSHLKDEYWPARIAAAETIGLIGDSTAVNHLLEALEDEDEDLALAAISSIGKIGDDQAVPGADINFATRIMDAKIPGDKNPGRNATLPEPLSTYLNY